jgi:cell wall-associated NlpC family hydrolase
MLLALLVSALLTAGCAGMKPNPTYKDDRREKGVSSSSSSSRSTSSSSRSKSSSSAKSKIVGRKAPQRTGGGDALDQQVNLWWGTPYAWGGQTVQKGADCSGYVCSVYRTVYRINLPRTTEQQWEQGRQVNRSQLRRGDLVFFNTDGSGVSHVGIYLGGGLFTHASNSDGVTIDRLDSSYYAKRFIGARRIR